MLTYDQNGVLINTDTTTTVQPGASSLQSFGQTTTDIINGVIAGIGANIVAATAPPPQVPVQQPAFAVTSNHVQISQNVLIYGALAVAAFLILRKA